MNFENFPKKIYKLIQFLLGKNLEFGKESLLLIPLDSLKIKLTPNFKYIKNITFQTKLIYEI